MRIALPAVPRGAAQPDAPLSCTRASTSSVRSSDSKRNEHLVEHDLVQELDARAARRAARRSARPRRSSARPARRRRCGRASAAPRRRRSRARGGRTRASSRPRRAPRRLVLDRGTRPRIAHRRAVRRPGAGRRRCPQSYGTLSHLCASVVHESARSTPATRWRSARADGRPQPERAVDVEPGARGLGARRRSPSAGRTAPVFTSPAWAQTIVGPPVAERRRAARRRRIRPWSSACDAPMRRAEPEQPQRAVDGARAAARRRARGSRGAPAEPVALDVPADRVEHVVARRRERGHVRHLRSR